MKLLSGIYRINMLVVMEDGPGGILFQPIRTLACMHGSAWQGDGVMLLRALADRLTREHYAPIISWPHHGHAKFYCLTRIPTIESAQLAQSFCRDGLINSFDS